MSIPLTLGYSAFVDLQDLFIVSLYTWSATQCRGKIYGRAYDPSTGRNVFLHRLLAGEDGLLVDHEDGDGLNCRRHNLRSATTYQNQQNKSKSPSRASRFKGVTACGGRWRARIRTDGKNKSLGVFDSQEEAASAYDAAAISLHGSFSRPNGEVSNAA